MAVSILTSNLQVLTVSIRSISIVPIPNMLLESYWEMANDVDPFTYLGEIIKIYLLKKAGLLLNMREIGRGHNSLVMSLALFNI